MLDSMKHAKLVFVGDSLMSSQYVSLKVGLSISAGGQILGSWLEQQRSGESHMVCQALQHLQQ